MEKLEFAILHEVLLERCFPAQLEELNKIADYKLYGYGEAKDALNTVRDKVSIVGVINTRALGNAARDYRKEDQEHEYDDPVQLPEKVKAVLLKYLGYERLSDLIGDYFKKKEISRQQYVLPKPLKYRNRRQRSKTGGSRTGREVGLENLVGTKWWYYTYLHSSKKDKPKILRKGFEIKRLDMNGDCEVSLWNRQPFSTFHGKIWQKYSGDNILACEMTSDRHFPRKRLYLLLHINFNLEPKDVLFLGIYLTHTDNASIRSGTVILEKIDKAIDEAALRRPHTFNPADDPVLNERFSEYFSDRNLNLLKIPSSIYHRIDFEKWLKEKHAEQDKIKYDLYISAPYRSLYNKKKQHDNMMSNLSMLFSRHIDKHAGVGGEGTIRNLEKKVKKMIDDHVWDSNPAVAHLSECENLQTEIQQVIEVLRTELMLKNIWYPPKDDDLVPDSYLDPGKLLNEQFIDFRSSRAYMFIFPQKVTSSILVQVGWALMATFKTPKPVFILYSEESDLPFLLQKADNLKAHQVYMESLQKIGGIPGIPKWMKVNGFHEYLKEL